VIDFLLKINNKYCVEKNHSFITKPDIDFIVIKAGETEIIFWGDPVLDAKDNFTNQNNNLTNLVGEIIQKVMGHYYFLIVDKITTTCIVGNSLFNILPVYYSKINGKLYLSSKPEKISAYRNAQMPEKRFILENIIFNYPLFNYSPFKEIHLLPSNHFIFWINGKLILKKHTNIEEYFQLKPNKYEYELSDISDHFLQRSSFYFPNQKYIHALTGGFDGRTLVSCSKYHNKDFETFSFGSENSTDTPVAKKLSEKAHINFNHFLLDDIYVQKHSYKNGIEFILNSSGTASFARAHYLYSAKVLSDKYNYIITGNFGSEILRALNIAGAVISPNLYKIIGSKTLDDAILKLRYSSELNFLNKDYFKNEFENLIEDIKELPPFSDKYSDLTQNQKFYIIVFEEVFRKYFGAEMKNQYNHIFNRTPFLDFKFLTRVLQSPLAGVHSDFFEQNPMKRFKGQILYSHIIRKAYPLFLNIPMDKGYKPSDLLTFFGKFNLIKAYTKKKIYNTNFLNVDPFSVKKSFNHNKQRIMESIGEIPLFNHTLINECLSKGNTRNNFFIALSQLLFYNHTFINKNE